MTPTNSDSVEQDQQAGRATLYVALVGTLFARYNDLFPNYSWTDESAALDLIAADLVTTRKELAQRDAEIAELRAILTKHEQQAGR